MRWIGEGPEFLLAHPGGPYFARKDEGAWTIPKGLIDANEDHLDAARREFREETGYEPPATNFHPLGSVRQGSGKIVHAWAFVGDFDPASLTSNTFEVEWPPRSGRMRAFPEIDRADFFPFAEATRKILPAQLPFLERASRPEALRALFGASRVPPPG